ncbi:hypothetical protein AOQ84DRAFT_354726 [Glonium stellatum]|uniref:Uncharacterized protein n=1 Tax=Glonium stellatum TaxID=574774 RepID=A0A8E2F122_9PEZI|nr:hypothetical protein AOQ84DRAFT_354726 [Glonium stellatum]
MLRHKPKIRLLHPTSDGTPPPTAVNAEIARDDGSSVAIEATEERLKASKNMSTPSLSQMLEHKTRENGQLRLELRRLRKRSL